MNRPVAILRRVISLGLLAFGIFQLYRGGFPFDESIPTIPWTVIFGALSLLCFFLGIAPDLAAPLASYLGDLAGRLFFPEARFSKPLLSYRLAEFYTLQERTEDAVAQYEEIIRHYPRERRAYSALISLARLGGDERKAAKYERLMMRRFPSRRRRGRP
jgi:hypothetical protein